MLRIAAKIRISPQTMQLLLKKVRALRCLELISDAQKAEANIDEEDDDEEGRFFGGGLNEEQNVCRS